MVATVGLSVYAHGLSALPLTGRYVAWYDAHPPEQLPAMGERPRAGAAPSLARKLTGAGERPPPS